MIRCHMFVKMAMLAEPRRKKKLSLDPRGSNWTNDDNKFGQKLMEKMGWSKGKGLGANLDGRMEPVKASLRTDNRGVGCSKTYADSWIAHQDDFNTLLANLGQDHGGGGNSSEEEAVRVSSLEEKSRTSRGRVHYHKFTKGKDLSLKSASDLDCVFGKRKSQSENNTPLNQSEVNSDASDTEENPSSGLKTVKSSDSIQSYFAKKMAEKKAKLNGDYVKDGDHLETATADKVEDDMSSRFDDRDELMSDVLINEKEEKKSKKKSKKSKKAKEEKVDDEGILFGKNNEIGDIECDSVPKVEKSDGIITDDVENVDSNDIENIEAASVKKMKKNKKSKKTKHEQVPDCDDFEEISENAKNESKVDLEDVSIAQVDEIKYKKSKKSKKSKKKDIKSIEKVAASNDTTNQGDTLQESDDICNKEDITSDNTTPKKKCKRSKKRTEATADGTDNHKSGENELHKSQTLVSEIEKNQTASSKKRKIEKGDNEMQNTKDTAKEVDNEGKESDNKRRRNGSDDFPNFDGDSAFNGANLSQIKGYSGLTQRVVVNGLKRRYSKKFQQK